MSRRAFRCTCLAAAFFVLLCGNVPAFDAFITMKDGYFYDAAAGKAWVPHGIAYQTWNRPLGVWQTHDQIDYDLDEMKKMGANSIRVDFVWQHIEEDGDNQFKWDHYDYLVQAAEARGIRIFALIGYQWPPSWFPDAWYTMHPPAYDSEGIFHPTRWQSDIINYEHAEARAQYAEWFKNVCGRYKNSKAIVAWIVGNESGFLGLWSGLLDGYDPECEQAFRNWCQAKYTAISNVNARWGTAYTNFNAIRFVEEYREYGPEGAEWADMVQWREDSIGSFTALGAKAAKAADTNHLISYSTVGMQWGEEDWRYHAEDRGKITTACAATNAPIDFFSVNNYPWSILGHESQNGHWGISYTKKVTQSPTKPDGVPVLYSETGFTSSESMWPGMNEWRQGPLVRNALWESLEAGAIGTHIFAWHDRPYITDREKGFGILTPERRIKPAYWDSMNVFQLMEQAQIADLLRGSKDPKPDIGFLWTAANDSQYNRYECEMQQIAGALERLGYEPNFVNLNDLGSGAYTNFKVICLPRNMRVDTAVPNSTNKPVLKFLRENVLSKGIHILASADLPGLQDENGRTRAEFSNEVAQLFGIDATDVGGFEVSPRTGNFISSNMAPVRVVFTNAVGVLTNGYTCAPKVWKYNDEVRVGDGTVWATMDAYRNKGFEEGSGTNFAGWWRWGDMTLQNWFPLEGTNMLQMWGDSGIFMDFPAVQGGRYTHSAYLRNNSDDPLRNGKQGYVAIEWYDEDENLLGTVESAHLTTNTPGNSWVLYKVDAVAPSNTIKGRRVVRITGPGDGALYVDNRQVSPALVVKNHGTAKAAIFLFSAGDMLPDGDGDGEMDTLPWKWRYDYFGAIVRDYFGVQPLVRCTGTNAFLCLPEYRTCTNGATLWQVKNYFYNRFATNYVGGEPLTFTIQSSLFTGKTIRAFEQGRLLETNSDGTISITLVPDGHDMLLAYAPGTNRQELVQLSSAPSVVHPGGDRVFQVKAKYDCAGSTGLSLKVAFKEAGDNGDGVTNEIYAIQTNAVTAGGEAEFWMWVPFYRQGDTDYKSTPDGGKYEFTAWLEKAGGVKVAQAIPRPAMLEWGVRPTASTPTNMTKGGTATLPVEWEDLYEPLSWENTPMTRNAGFPSRIAVLRSSKTEAQYAGHFTRVNAVSDWLETLGYTAGNPLDISFDNVNVAGLFSDNFEDGNYTGWTRAAGCANWAVQAVPKTHGQALSYDRQTTFGLYTANRRLAFKIVADAWKTVDKIYVYARTYGTSPVYRLNVCKDNAGVPDAGSVVATATFTVPSTAYNWVAIDLPDFQWSAGSTYHLVLGYASGTISTARYAAVQYAGRNSPDRGVLTSANAGSTWTQQIYEPTFRVLYTDGSSYSQPYASYSSITILGATRYGQQFRPTEATAVTNVAVLLKKANNVAGNVSMQLRRWSDKAVLATSTVARAQVAQTNRWINFRFSPAATLGGGTQYFFEVVNLGVTGAYYLCRDNALGAYGAYTWDSTSNATVYSLNTGRTWSAQTHYDFGYVLTGSTSNKALRAWRIGNSDNIMLGSAVYTNHTVSADIRYNKQDRYYDDAEIYFHYQDRANYYRIGIRNYFEAWRLKYTVMAQSNMVAQGWLYDFAKTNRPVENAWYNLKIDCRGNTNRVYFNNVLVGTFWATNVPSGRIAVGSRALQLGNWEPQMGYYFVDDDEWSLWAPEGTAQTRAKPLDLDYGYLRGYFNTMILPSVYVMSDIEVSNLLTWATGAMNSAIVFDGGLAMKNETGAYDLGRVESLLGVEAATLALSNVTKTTVGGADHYVTLDYAPGAEITAKGSATAYTTLNGAQGLGTLQNAGNSAPAFIANVLMPQPETPVKVFCFNCPADTQGQLTNEARQIAQRAFEWARGDAFKVKASLMYDVQASDPKYNIVVYSTNIWVLASSGSNTITVTLPTDGIMTGTNLFWSFMTYPWDASDDWGSQAGFYSSDLDNRRVRLPGKGLQLLGGPTNAWGGRDWGVWLAYNTEGQACTLTYGLKDKGALQDEDNFDDGNYTGWTVQSHPNIAWTVTNGALRASVVSTGGYASITRDGLALGTTNLTFEYDTRFMNGARHGGAVYRGVVLYVNPQLCGWSDNYQNYVTNGTGITTGKWHHVVIKVRDGSPNLRSDLIVDNKAIFLDEPIDVTSFATNTVGFLSPYNPGYVEWDNVRVADEQYTFVTQAANGVCFPTSDVTPHVVFVPDFDPAMWEHEGTALGGRYEWFAYLNGQGVHGAQDTEVYFAPRIMNEDTNFVTALNPGQTVKLPIEWERLPEVPMRLTITLQDAWSGNVYATNTINLDSAGGTTLVPVQIPEQTPSGAGYSWGTMVYPTNVPDPWPGRLGADDTFRYGLDGMPVEPELMIAVSPVVGGDYVVYRDAGLPAGFDVSTWAGGATTFDGSYTGGNAPEGAKCFLTACSSWAGWGVIAVTGSVDLTEYRDGFLKFWLRSTATVKVELEQLSGTKATKYIGSTTNVWKEITLPVSDFSAVNLAQIKGLFEITSDTATTFYVDHVRFVKGIYRVYCDAGIPAGTRYTNWTAGTAVFDPHYADGAAPEGTECYQSTSAVSAGWGVVTTNGTTDMRLYTNGYVTFWARSAGNLKIELEGPAGTKRSATVAPTTNAWKEISVPLSAFSGINLAQMRLLFAVTATNGATFLVDDVRWEKGTNAVPSEKKETFYSDAGLPAGANVLVWAAYNSWSHLSASVNDGGFESSANGSFPTSGYWGFSYAAAGATSLCSAAAVRTGALGLRAQTGSGTTAYWGSTWQEYYAFGEDILAGQAYVRQPTGTTWVAGSTAFLRMQFLDAWWQVITNVDSATKVTTAGQAWTLCAIPQTTAPLGTRYVRLALVVQKPNGSAGASVADFDDAWLGQYNSFAGQFAEDPLVPEGARCFRSYCVYWSGWGIFYTNSVTNLSQYANGYVKFWYKSSGSTKIEIQSAWGGVTNKASYPTIGWFGPTLNDEGELIWKQLSIPVSFFAGVDLAHIQSPFAVTDPQYDHSFYVDDVRWTMSP